MDRTRSPSRRTDWTWRDRRQQSTFAVGWQLLLRPQQTAFITLMDAGRGYSSRDWSSCLFHEISPRDFDTVTETDSTRVIGMDGVGEGDGGGGGGGQAEHSTCRCYLSAWWRSIRSCGGLAMGRARRKTAGAFGDVRFEHGLIVDRSFGSCQQIAFCELWFVVPKNTHKRHSFHTLSTPAFIARSIR